MAINMSDKRYISEIIIPEIEFNVNTNGITLQAKSRLSTPRFLPFDQCGRCRECKSIEVEIDFVVTKEGVTVYCNRIKGNRFVPFDSIYDMPGHCFFRIKNKGRVLNIPFNDRDSVEQKKSIIQPLSSYPDKTEQEKDSGLKIEHELKTTMDVENNNEIVKTTQEKTETIKTVEEELDDFFKSIANEKNVVKRSFQAIKMLNNNTILNKSLKFKLPFGMIISGPSSSGKSTFLIRLISQAFELIDPKPNSILYCYGEMSSIVPVLQRSGVNVYGGVPTEEMIKRYPKPLLLILDDLLLTIDEKYLSELFTKKSHHQNFAIIFVTQNLFEKKIKVARQNAQYLILMRSPNSALSVRNIGTQLFPRKLDFFLDAYRQATNEPYGYLLIDMHASSDPILRLRSNIFTDDNEKLIFIPKNGT
uniref:Uncharacterized protein n=3 Tax=Meloidogyne enterolobii TaxID=390850 RepID=A0A6V7WUM0_MELEN|nr:unnamed protein product [Meloidogyne enterolobii]